MTLVCPNCGSRNIRYSHLRTPRERLASLIGIRPLRCRECRQRFEAKVWDPADLPYARCPKCLNMRLSTWSPSHYHVTAGRGLLLFFGANPYRCEMCRYNFVSFRPRKYRYKRSREAAAGRRAPVAAPEDKGQTP
jgi:predicted Zn-ribbon and HTH transcriptional regulator